MKIFLRPRSSQGDLSHSKTEDIFKHSTWGRRWSAPLSECQDVHFEPQLSRKRIWQGHRSYLERGSQSVIGLNPPNPSLRREKKFAQGGGGDAVERPSQ